MADNRKYYYLKLKENFFDSDSIVLLEDMKDGILYSNILLKLYLKSLKNGGKLQLDEHIPYTAQMIATLPEALEAYEKIPAERMNGIKSVGFNLQEGSDYDGMMDLMVAGRSQREILDSIPFYKENKLVQEALKRVEQYIEEKSLNVEKTRPKEEKGEIQKTKSQKRREDMSL